MNEVAGRAESMSTNGDAGLGVEENEKTFSINLT